MELLRTAGAVGEEREDHRNSMVGQERWSSSLMKARARQRMHHAARFRSLKEIFSSICVNAKYN